MENVIFSIIVPFYNKQHSLDNCLKSLLSQDFPKEMYEIIAIDNNSTDNSLSIISKYLSIKLLHEKQQGAYAARNTGILNSNGSLMVFTDADVEVPQDWLSNIYRSVNKNSYDILIGWYAPARPIKLLQIHSLLISQRIKKAIEQKAPSMLTACAANLIVKKEVFEREGLFLNISNSEDMYFTIRCLEKGYNIGFDTNIEIKRNDIDSISIFLLKNFIYGCSNALDIKHKLSFLGRLKYISITIKYIFKYFPEGLGLILFTFSYFSGYILSKSKILNSKRTANIVNRYTSFVNKRRL